MGIEEKKEFFDGLVIVILALIVSFMLFYEHPLYMLLAFCAIVLTWIRYLGQLSKKYPRKDV